MENTVIVIGGGLSGLISAAALGRAGARVVLFEKSGSFGGRAATREKHGFRFNLGPHAVYRHGILRQTLKEFGIDLRGGIPGANGGFGIEGDRLHTLPVGLASMITTGALTLAGKLEFARLYARLPGLDPSPFQRETLSHWLDFHLPNPSARRLFEMLVRVSTFTNDPAHQSAGAAIEQLQLAIRGNVLYLDDGWQTMVDELRRVALGAGVRFVDEAAVSALERRDDRAVDAVRLANGSVARASAVIIAATPADVESITHRAWSSDALPPAVRVATLDLGLKTLPRPTRTVAFGLDRAVYYSVHSAVARLAPEEGATIHVSKYLAPAEHAGSGTERELEGVMDLLQPGWRAQVAVHQFLPNLVVTHAEATAAIGGVAGRPGVQLEGFDNVFLAGEWVGPRGQLSDACAASALDAAAAVLRRAATSSVAA